LDIPALSLSRNTGTLSPINTDLIALPEIQPPTQTDSRSVYSLPPISALEDLRGVDTHDSAAVLRRLQSPDDFESSQIMGDQKWRERRSLSAPAPKYAPPHYSCNFLLIIVLAEYLPEQACFQYRHSTYTGAR
jgi:hypothetical protein